MKKSIVYSLSISIILISCYPKGPEYYEDLDVVYTNYDDEYDFTSKATYVMPDSIVKITGDLGDGATPEYVKEPINSEILGMIEVNMTALGWTRIDDPANADLTLLPAVWSNTTIYYWYNYWCWYYPYYCGWGWYYPSVSSYTTGTLVMTLVDDSDDYFEPTRMWTGAINGLLSGSYNISRVKSGIDQAFEQSPYLNVK